MKKAVQCPWHNRNIQLPLSAITCSKLTIEMAEQGKNYVQS